MNTKHTPVTVYAVTAGAFERHYYTEHHAEQMRRALFLSGMDDAKVTAIKLPDDALTRIAAFPKAGV